jgi:hypothetical protein
MKERVIEVWEGVNHLSTLTYVNGALRSAQAAPGAARLMLYMVAEDEFELNRLMDYTKEVNAKNPDKPQYHTHLKEITPTAPAA